VWVGFLNVYKANLDVALKVISKTSAIGAGTVDLVGEGVSKSLLPPMAPPQVAPGTPMTQEEIGERAAMTPEMTPELEAISKRYLDFAKPLLANPGTPLALRNKLTEDAKALAEAIQKRDLATIGRIMGGVQQ
jgi:hypothetical protein